MNKELTLEDVKGFEKDFDKNGSLKISKNAVMRNGVFNAAFDSEEDRKSVV